MSENFASAQEFQAAVGRAYGPTQWMLIEQARINAFADATDDHQWIHVDTARAASGPFAGTIAHGFLTLALAYHFLPQLIAAPQAKLCINYGCDRVRFPAVVRAGSQVRARAEILAAGEVGGGAVQVKTQVTIEVQGSDKPVCVADTLSRYYF
ncbi:MAG TPA: MaoC family dehydratase [Steroidobacteraceae bacterium]|jgi:acyl dehydratase|nr:MaoC family dehydratase [Steroidobacteraceae bacterium]